MADDSKASNVGDRYAQALFDLATEQKQIAAVEADLTSLKAALAESKDLRTLLGSPAFGAEDKSKGLAAIAAAAMGRDGDDRLASLTLFAAQTDFTEAGELQLFTSEGEVAFLEDVMWRQGYLDGSQMAAAFQLLRSNDLVWSRMLRTYLLGRRDLPSDLMTWNADVTRLPFRMHSEYLRRLFLGNDLAEGRFPVEGRPIALEDVRPDVFVVATETDHVAPWRSVYKLHLLNPGRIDFVLTSGGHNAGIVSEPGHPGRHYRLGERPAGAGYVAPDDWLTSNAPREGSWWPAWTAWLAAHGGAPVPAKPTRSAGLGPAPGSYVLQP